MKKMILLIVSVFIVGSIFYLQSLKPKVNTINDRSAEIPIVAAPVTEKSAVAVENKKEIMPSKKLNSQYPRAKEITTPAGFINTEKITVAENIGKKVILVDFWTYSCINCQRTTPYLNAWWEKYKDKGLLIIGVHTPEFAFEKEYQNVKTAVEKFGIKYPVVLDNDYGTWNAYGNRYWPRKYLIDINGQIVYDHIGEGFYDETENKIQELLSVREEMVKPKDVVRVDEGQPRSPEIYFGAGRNLYLGNGLSQRLGQQTFKEPAGVKTNILYLAGDWDFSQEYAENKTANAKVIFRYQAKNVYFVAQAAEENKISIFQDGQLIKSEIVKPAQLYKLIEDKDYGEHTLEIQIKEPGLRAFTFTFG